MYVTKRIIKFIENAISCHVDGQEIDTKLEMSFNSINSSVAQITHRIEWIRIRSDAEPRGRNVLFPLFLFSSVQRFRFRFLSPFCVLLNAIAASFCLEFVFLSFVWTGQSYQRRSIMWNWLCVSAVYLNEQRTQKKRYQETGRIISVCW